MLHRRYRGHLEHFEKGSHLVVKFLLGIVILVALWIPEWARAGNKVKFWETVGVSTAVGASVGASTLPFYERPGENLKVIGYGAACGFTVGTGIWLYHWLTRSEEEIRMSELPISPSPYWLPLLVLNW